MAKPQKFPLQPKKFLSSSSHSFYFTLFHQQNNTWKWMWRMKRREKVQLKFRDKKSIFMSSYIFYETAVCCSWLFCCRCKYQKMCTKHIWTLNFMIRLGVGEIENVYRRVKLLDTLKNGIQNRVKRRWLQISLQNFEHFLFLLFNEC